MGRRLPKQPPPRKKEVPELPKQSRSARGPEQREDRQRALEAERRRIEEERLRRIAKKETEKAEMDELTAAFGNIGNTPNYSPTPPAGSLTDFGEYARAVETTPPALPPLTPPTANPYPDLFYVDNENPIITKVEAEHNFDFSNNSYFIINENQERIDINNEEDFDRLYRSSYLSGGKSMRRKKRRTNKKQPSKAKKGSKRKSSRRRTSKKTKR